MLYLDNHTFHGYLWYYTQVHFKSCFDKVLKNILTWKTTDVASEIYNIHGAI